MNARMTPLTLSIGALLAAMISIQYGATLAKDMFKTVGAQGTTALRLCVGAIILGVVLRPWRLRPTRGHAPALIGYGAALGAMNLSFYMAISTIPLGIAVALEFTGPLVLATVSSRRAADFAWIGLAVLGLLLLSPLHSRHALDPAGVLWALSAASCWALYIVFGQKTGNALGSQTTAVGLAVGALLIAPVGWAYAGPALFKPSVLMAAIGVGVFSSALPFSLEMVALTRLPARVYGTLTSLEPALGAFMGLTLLHERLSASQWVGIGVVIAAAFGAAATVGTPPASPA